jgi:hypothetical protein
MEMPIKKTQEKAFLKIWKLFESQHAPATNLFIFGKIDVFGISSA